MSDIEVIGIAQLKVAFENLKGKIRGATINSIQESVLDLQGKAQRIAPKYKGPLRGSGDSGVKIEGSRITGIVSFDKPYALEQHENLEYHHDDGQAKYLEQPFNENSGDYIEELKKAIKEEL